MTATTRTTQASNSAAGAQIVWWPGLGVVRSICTGLGLGSVHGDAGQQTHVFGIGIRRHTPPR